MEPAEARVHAMGTPSRLDDSVCDVTRLLDRLRAGEGRALPDLVEAVQGELRGLASRYLQKERRDHTLQPTALVNEAYLRLVDQRDQGWESKSHFLAIAATAMRRVLLEHARGRMAAKRGGGVERVTLFDVSSAAEERPEVTVALDEALERFAKIDPQNAKVVELRWFGGLGVGETAAALGVSTRTVERGWRVASAWLRCRLEEE